MKKFFVLFLIIGMLSLAVYADDAVTTGVKKVLDDQEAAWNRGNLKAFMQGYWKSKDLTFASRGEFHQGWDAVYRRYIKTYGQNRSKMGKLRFSGLVIVPLGSQAALTYGRWHLAIGKEKLGGVFSLVLRKFPEGWRIIHDHTSRRPES